MTNPLGNKIYLVVGLIIIVGLAIAAFFLFPNLIKEKDTTDTSTSSGEKVEIYGQVHEIDADAGTFTIEEVGTETLYKINVNDSTSVSELGTGNSFNISDISVGQTIQIVTSNPKSSGGGSGGGSGSSGGGSGGGDSGDDGIIVIDDPDDVIIYPKDPSSLPKVGD